MELKRGISVIIPAYNVEKYVKNCIDSIINQGFSDLEVIVINDGSSDGTLEILEKYNSNDNVMVIDQANQGVSHSRNVGIELATKEYILFVDSDDWIEPELCEIYNFASSNDLDFLICAHRTISTIKIDNRYIFGDKNVVFDSFTDIEEKIKLPTLGRYDGNFKPQQLDRLTPVWARLYKTSIIKKNKIKFIDMKLIPSECLQFNFDFCQFINKAGYIPVVLYNYRRNVEISITKKYRADLLRKWIWWEGYFKKKYTHLLQNEKYYHAYIYRICSSLIPLGGNAIKAKGIKNQIKEIKVILHEERINTAIKSERFNSSNVIWKSFFAFARYKKVSLFMISTIAMRTFLNLRKK
ncbi:glycosyltransferase family 2 protein [Enterococcus sp.]|uniref:glycosyltransferase family 2 protein n=1 Tax=Enterococcus sp. TaxID=35783 RepID=UPI00289AF557|nr:glycosyltransferase family 2 protein [Enterococcus sp.]